MTQFKQELPFPGMPSKPSRRDVANAVVVCITKYRVAKTILPTEQLTHQQVEEIVDGVRSMIYQHEELKQSKHE